MKKILNYWYVFVFIALTAVIYYQQRTFLSFNHYHSYLFAKPIYGVWPTITFQEEKDLKAAPEGSQIVMFRGNPERQGQIAGVLASKYKVDWTFADFNSGAHGAAKASPVADDEGIYVGSDMGWFYHFGWDGKLKWRIYHETAIRGIHGTATIDGDYLFYGDYAGYLLAVNKRTGQVLWTRHLGDTLGASPLVLGDFIYANIEINPSSGFLAKLNKFNGELIYKSPLFFEQSHSSPALDESSKTLVFGANNNVLYGINLLDGEMSWTFQAPGQIKSTPVIYEGRSYYTDWGKRFTSNDNKTGAEIFSVPLKTMAVNSPALVKSGIVVPDREDLYLFSFSGQLLHKLPLNNKFYFGSPLVVKNKEKETILVACDENKNLCAVDAELKNKKVLYKGEKKFSSVPFVYQDKIIFAQDDGDLVVLRKSE